MRADKSIYFFIAPLLLMLSTAFAQTYSTVYTFDGNVGKYPSAPLVQGRDGNLYGTTSAGGTFGLGTVFRVSPDGSRFAALHNFAGSDGSYPDGLVLAKDGNFYGTAGAGALDAGVIYRINSSGTMTVLYNFTGGADGSGPANSLIQGTDGNFYGANKSGVYRYSPPGAPEIIYPFSYPQPLGTVSQMTQGTDGMLYLVISEGGIYDCGSISKLSLQGAVQWERDFGTPGTCYQYLKTGYDPSAPVIQASDGNLYGTNATAGVSGYGTDFRLSAASGTMAVLHSFSLFDGQGDLIYAGLVQGTDGNLYGVAADGGAFPFAGVIYNLSLTGTYTFLSSVLDNQEDGPDWSLLQHTSGKFYSVNLDGGTDKAGTVYSFDNNLGPFVALVQSQGKVGSTVQILGQGLAGVSGVTFNGVPAPTFSVTSGTYMTAVVPTGATTGPVVVSSATRSLKSNKNYSISQ